MTSLWDVSASVSQIIAKPLFCAASCCDQALSVFQEMMSRWFFMMWRGGWYDIMNLLSLLMFAHLKTFICERLLFLQKRNSERVPAHRCRVQFVCQPGQRQRVCQLLWWRTRPHMGHPRAAKRRWEDAQSCTCGFAALSKYLDKSYDAIQALDVLSDWFVRQHYVFCGLRLPNVWLWIIRQSVLEQTSAAVCLIRFKNKIQSIADPFWPIFSWILNK